MPIDPRIDYVKIFDVYADHVDGNELYYYDKFTVNALVERALLDDRNRAEKAYRKIVERVTSGLGNSSHERQLKELVRTVIENVIQINASDPEEYTRVK